MSNESLNTVKATDLHPTVDLSERGETNRYPSRLRTIGKTAVLSSLAILFGTAVGTGVANADRIAYNVEAASTMTDQNNAMSDIASEIADMPLRVHCSNEGMSWTVDGSIYHAEAFVRPVSIYGQRYAPPVMTIRSELCDTILSTNFDSSEYEHVTSYYEYINQMAPATLALAIVLHEAEHNHQIANEAQAECNSIQKLPEALETLGVSPDDAMILARIAMNDSSSGYLADEYYSEECAPGGDYDLGLNDLFVQAPEYIG